MDPKHPLACLLPRPARLTRHNSPCVKRDSSGWKATAPSTLGGAQRTILGPAEDQWKSDGMNAVVGSLVGVLVGGFISVYFQHQMAKRDRAYATLLRVANALAGAEFVLSSIEPDRFVWGGPNDWWPALDEALDGWRDVRRELKAATYIVEIPVRDSIQTLIETTSEAVIIVAELLRARTDRDNTEEDRLKAVTAHRAAEKQHEATSEMVHTAVHAPLIRLPRLSSGRSQRVTPRRMN